MSKGRLFVYGFLVLLGLGLAATPFVLGGFTLAGAAEIIAQFVALPVAKLLFTALYEMVGPWAGLAIVSAIPLAAGIFVDATTKLFSLMSKAFTSDKQEEVHSDNLFQANATLGQEMQEEAPKNVVAPDVEVTPADEPESNAESSNEASNDELVDEAEEARAVQP